jgi:hypothetical protein
VISGFLPANYQEMKSIIDNVSLELGGKEFTGKTHNQMQKLLKE